MHLPETVISLFAPHSCLGCGREGQLLCAGCMGSELVGVPSRCFLCHKQTKQHAVCPACRRKVPLAHVWVCSEYEGLAKQLVARLKFGRTAGAARTIAAVMADTLPRLDDTVIVPVPTATSRVRQRGYDQAKLIARELSRTGGMPQIALLTRFGQQRQVGAKKQVRATQLEQAFFVPHPALAASFEHVLLVDDITTTGATLSAAAKALKAAGVKRVSAITFAQRNL